MEVKLLDKKDVEMKEGLEKAGVGFMADYLNEARKLMNKQQEMIKQLEECPKCGGKMVPCRLRCKSCGHETEKIKKV